MSPCTPSFIFSFCQSQGLQSLGCVFMLVVWSLHVQGLALFLGLNRSKVIFINFLNHHRVPCPPHTIHILIHYLKVILSVGFYHSSIYGHMGCKVLTQYTRSVANTEALNESCKLSLSWTLLTRRRDYLPVKLSQEII